MASKNYEYNILILLRHCELRGTKQEAIQRIYKRKIVFFIGVKKAFGFNQKFNIAFRMVDFISSQPTSINMVGIGSVSASLK